MIVVQKRSGANSVAVAQGVQKQLKTIMPSLPSDVNIYTIVDTSGEHHIDRELAARHHRRPSSS